MRCMLGKIDPIASILVAICQHADGGEVEDGDDKLEDVWREGTPLGKQLSAVHALFGTSVQPYTPGAAIEQVFF